MEGVMSLHDLPMEGGVDADRSARIHLCWLDAATRAGINLSGFDSTATFASRREWALKQGLLIGGVLSRFSKKMQHSTEAQVRECVVWAAQNKMYTPPELVCCDEAVTGKKTERV